MVKEVPESISKMEELNKQLEKLNFPFFESLLKSINEIHQLLQNKPKNSIGSDESDNKISHLRKLIDDQKTQLDNFQKTFISWLNSATSEIKGLDKNKGSFENNISSYLIENNISSHLNRNLILLSFFKTNQKEEKIFIFKTHFFTRAGRHLCESGFDEYSTEYKEFWEQFKFVAKFKCILNIHLDFVFCHTIRYWRNRLFHFDVFKLSIDVFSKLFEANKSGLGNFIDHCNSYNLSKV